MCFHPGGAERGTHPGLARPSQPSRYHPFPLRASADAASKVGAGRDSTNGETTGKVWADAGWAPDPPFCFVLFIGGKGSDSQLPGSDNKTFVCM